MANFQEDYHSKDLFTALNDKNLIIELFRSDEFIILNST